MKKVELLAPAGNFNTLKTAVYAGADAVYFGGKGFNARAKAQNFGLDLKDAVAFCHMHNVKAYFTLNTLIDNDQISELLDCINDAIFAGVDAFIVQDFGVLYILKKYYKNIEIHASTQMAVNNYLGAVQAQKMGVSRVVVSREISLEDIRLIKQNTNLQVEAFVQGALCVCFSGNCYLSSYMFGKSGNKGECLQPCRLPVKALIKGKEIKKGYLLSAKDICMANRLKDLIEVGVDSFKIEGRLRRVGYVGQVVKTYKKIINNKKLETTDLQQIKKAFNRGDFTEGYLNGNNNIIYEYIQGHTGICIGKVIAFNKGKKFNTLKIKSQHNISKGDGLKIIDDTKEISTITAMDIKNDGNIYTITTTANTIVGANVHLILDAESERAFESYTKKLNVYFTLIAKENQNICLEYKFNNISGKVYGGVCVKALSSPLSKESAFNQLSKLNDTYFCLDKFDFFGDNVFVTKSELNNLRRSAIEQLEKEFYSSQVNIQELEYIKQRVLNDYKNILCPQEQANACVVCDKSHTVGVADACGQANAKHATKVNFAFDKLAENYDNINNAKEITIIRPSDYKIYNFSLITNKNVYLYIPSFLRNQDIKIIDKILFENPNLNIYAENIGALSYNRPTILGAKLNIKNVFAIKQLLKSNVVGAVVSVELSEENFNLLQKATNLPLYKCSFLDMDLMTLVHCPIKMLFNNTCKNCKYQNNIVYKMDNLKEFQISRYKLANCYFVIRKDKYLYTP